MRPIRRLLAALLLSVLTVTGGPAAAQDLPPNEPGLSRQWGLTRVGAPVAWAAGARGAGVTIAIVDSGVSATHPDLDDNLLPLVDCVGQGPCMEGLGADNAGHGTHVAGIAAAETGNSEGRVAGVAPDADLLSVRALDCEPIPGQGGCDARGTVSDVAEAIHWAADHGADVINLSLGSLTQDVIGPANALREAMEHAWSVGAIPVIVAGNNNALLGSLLDLPAVVVAATTRDDTVASYSSAVGNARWAVSAPGGEGDPEGAAPGEPGTCASDSPVGILSTYRSAKPVAEDGYACIAGTSMAAPHVSGALAVLLGTGLSPTEAIDLLLRTAVDLGNPGRDLSFGEGRIDLTGAIGELVANGGVQVPVPDPSSTSTTAAAEPEVTVPPTVAVPTAPAPPTTAPPVVESGVTTPPVSIDSAVGSNVLPEGDNESLPALPLTVAVLLIVGAASGHAWRYLAVTPWARRTPDR